MKSSSIKIAQISAWTVISLGVITLIGWIFNIVLLKSISVGLVPLKPNAAVEFILSGLFIIIWTSGKSDPTGKSLPKKLMPSIIIVFMVVAFLTIVEYLIGINLGIDQLLFSDTSLFSVHPGRMAPNAVLLFLIVGLAFIFMSDKIRYKNKGLISGILGLVVTSAGIFSLADYPWFSSENLIGKFNPMAIQAAIGFAILGAGIFALSLEMNKIPWSLKKTITIGFISGMILMTGMDVYSDLSIANLQDSSQMVVHTREVQYHIAEASSVLQQLEINKQIYLLTGNKKYRNLSLENWNAFSSEIKVIKKLTADNPVQQSRTKQLTQLWEERLDLLNKTYSTFDLMGNGAEVEKIYFQKRNDMLTKINKILDDADNEEKRLLAIRDEESSGTSRRTFFLVPLGSFGSTAILVWIFMLLNSEVTERLQSESALKKSESHLNRANRLYSVLSQISHNIVEINDKQKLFDESCRILVEFGKFSMAWFGEINEVTKFVKPVSYYGVNDGYLDNILISINDSEFQKGPTGIAIITKQHNICNDIKNDPRMEPWKERALNLNFKSSAAFPVLQPGKFPIPLTVYSSELGFFTEDEIKLMNAICLEISFALQSYEKENERREKEVELFKLNEDLNRSNQELEQFAYVASHDLQEPLRMVASFTQLLEKRYKDKLDDDAKEFIHYAVDGASRMQRLINDLLDYSRVTTQGKPLVKIDLSAVLGMAVANLHNRIQESGALVVNDNLPFVKGDEIQLMRVFQNLIDNAIKFKGDESPKIIIKSEIVNNKAVISVEDNGIGIDFKYKERIFIIFQRLHSIAKYTGTGIGLAVCRRTVERHGGKIWFESEPGKGTTFKFTLNI
jgi:signal transduction histidine kinase/CHASE3 domain sensor protein